jgi:hypothetical protein
VRHLTGGRARSSVPGRSGSLTNWLDHRPDQVTHCVHQVLEGEPIGLVSAGDHQVLLDVVDGRFQPIEAIAEPDQISYGNDALVVRDVELACPPPRLVGPLAMGRAAEQSGTSRPRPQGKGSVAPAASVDLGGSRHGDDGTPR